MVNLRKNWLVIYKSTHLGPVFVSDNEITVVKFFDIFISGTHIEL